MLLRGVRWIVAVLAALAVLFGVWWLLGLWGVDGGVAAALAAAVTAAVQVPVFLWAKRDDSRARLVDGGIDESVRRKIVTRRSAVLGALLTGAVGVATGVLLALFVGSTTSILVWVGPGGPYPIEALPPENRIIPPHTTYLADLTRLPESDSVETGPMKIVSNSFTKSVFGVVRCSKVTSVTYPLDGSFHRFAATAGPSRESRTGNSIVYTIYLDSRLAETFEVMTGETHEVNLPVARASRMRITWEDGGTGRCFSGLESYAVLGDARLVVE